MVVEMTEIRRCRADVDHDDHSSFSKTTKSSLTMDLDDDICHLNVLLFQGTTYN
jgi:hypothetical protein